MRCAAPKIAAQRHVDLSVVLHLPMGVTTVVMAQREMGRRLSYSRSDM